MIIGGPFSVTSMDWKSERTIREFINQTLRDIAGVSTFHRPHKILANLQSLNFDRSVLFGIWKFAIHFLIYSIQLERSGSVGFDAMSILHLSAETLLLRQPLSLSRPPPSYSSTSYLSLSPSKFLLRSSTSSSITTLHSAKLRYGRRLSFVTRASSSDFSESIGDILGDVGIFTATGEPVMFKDLWDQKEGMAVVAFLRHFGCPCCWELASVLKEFRPRFDSAGVKLIAVGVGTPNKARLLAERLPFPLDCLYADPDRKAYDVLGLYYGFGRTFFNPASAKVFSRYKSLQKAVKNYTIEATPDDRSSVLQQGGMLIFKGKQLVYARKDEGTGDHASLDDILDICCKAPVA